MKIINCGIVTYIIIENHIATICYNYNNGEPYADIYYDGKFTEVVSVSNGQTMRYAVMCATSTLRIEKYIDGLRKSDD